MTRMTPKAVPSRRKRAALVAAATLIVLGLGFRTADAARSPRMFQMNYCWGTGWPSFAVCPAATLSLYSNGTVYAVDAESGATGTGRWSTPRHGRITFTFPGVTYTGSAVSSGCYQGTMTSPNVGGGGSWAGCYTP